MRAAQAALCTGWTSRSEGFVERRAVPKSIYRYKGFCKGTAEGCKTVKVSILGGMRIVEYRDLSQGSQTPQGFCWFALTRRALLGRAKIPARPCASSPEGGDYLVQGLGLGGLEGIYKAVYAQV